MIDLTPTHLKEFFGGETSETLETLNATCEEAGRMAADDFFNRHPRVNEHSIAALEWLLRDVTAEMAQRFPPDRNPTMEAARLKIAREAVECVTRNALLRRLNALYNAAAGDGGHA